MTAVVEWVDRRGFDALATEWEPLAEATGYPFARHGWFAAFADAFCAPGEVTVCVVREAGELRAALPLFRRGGVLAGLANAHTPVLVPLAADEPALQLLADAVAGAAPAELVLQNVPAEHPAVAAFAAASRRARRAFWAEPSIASPVVEATGTFADYRAAVGRNLRKESERRRRRLLEAGGAVHALAPPQDVQAELGAGLAVEASGWKARQGTAILADPATERFYRALADELHRAGRLRFSTVHVEGRLAAFAYNLVDLDRAWSLKFGMDDDFRHFAAGIVSTYVDIETTYEQGLAGYELLGDAEPWKLRFADATRQHVVIRSFRRRPGPLARVAYRRFVRPRLRDGYRALRARGVNLRTVARSGAGSRQEPTA